MDALLPFAEKNESERCARYRHPGLDVKSARMFLDRGGSPGINALTAMALSNEAFPVDLIEALVTRGGNVNGTTSLGGSILDLARLQGETPLSAVLTSAGAKGSPAPNQPALASRSLPHRPEPLSKEAFRCCNARM